MTFNNPFTEVNPDRQRLAIKDPIIKDLSEPADNLQDEVQTNRKASVDDVKAADQNGSNTTEDSVDGCVQEERRLSVSSVHSEEKLEGNIEGRKASVASINTDRKQSVSSVKDERKASVASNADRKSSVGLLGVTRFFRVRQISSTSAGPNLVRHQISQRLKM